MPTLCSRAAMLAARDLGGALNLWTASGGVCGIPHTAVGPHGRSTIRDSGREILADLRFSAATDFQQDSSYDHTTVHGEFMRLRRGVNGIAALTRLTVVMLQTGPGLITATADYGLRLQDGTTADGMTFCPLALPRQARELPTVQFVTIDVTEPRFESGQCILRTRSVVSPLGPGAT